MALILALAGVALLLARLLGAPRGSWRFILAAAAIAALASQLLPAGHPLRADLLGSAETFGWLLVALIPLTAYALWLRALRRRAGTARPGPAGHPTGLVQIPEDAALVADTSAALDAGTIAALGPPRPLSLAWRAADGSLAGHLRLHQAGATAEIELLLVAPGHRGAGIGTRLLAAAEAEARARGLARLAIAPGSWQDAGFFTHAGFVTTAELPLGPGARRYWMERPLS
jgi:GNAT superfamily N-acetyltransferase